MTWLLQTQALEQLRGRGGCVIPGQAGRFWKGRAGSQVGAMGGFWPLLSRAPGLLSGGSRAGGAAWWLPPRTRDSLAPLGHRAPGPGVSQLRARLILQATEATLALGQDALVPGSSHMGSQPSAGHSTQPAGLGRGRTE